MEGNGKFSDTNGYKYEGNYKNDLYDGYGVLTWANNDCFKGNFVKGKMEGGGEFSG